MTMKRSTLVAEPTEVMPADSQVGYAKPKRDLHDGWQTMPPET